MEGCARRNLCCSCHGREPVLKVQEPGANPRVLAPRGAPGRLSPRHGVSPPKDPAHGRICTVCRVDTFKRAKKRLRAVCAARIRTIVLPRESVDREPRAAAARRCACASATRASTASARASLLRATSRTESACARWPPVGSCSIHAHVRACASRHICVTCEQAGVTLVFIK
jgi:hypothetical protein